MDSTASLDFDIKLIELVKLNPVLYEKQLRNAPYDTMRKKSELWKSIAVSLNTDSRYCITRWKALRERFQHEFLKKKELLKNTLVAKDSTWIMYEKLLFLTSHKSYSLVQKGTQSHKQNLLNNVQTESYDEDPLQEAMDEQNSEKERNEAGIVEASSSSASATSTAEHSHKNLRTMLALLEGIDEVNRAKAEKRIVAYLCKCQLKSLNGEDIDDVTI